MATETPFGDVMAAKYPDYAWESKEVQNDDGYIFTMYNVWSETNVDDSLGPVLWMNGSSGDASALINYGGASEWSPPDAAPIQMAELGYNVWFWNIRGTSVSQQHTEYSVTSEEYWQWTVDDLAEDLVLFASTVRSYHPNDNKGWYFGYSLGGMQAMIALASQESEMAEYFERVVILAPCTGVYEDYDTSAISATDDSYPGYLYDSLASIGIYWVGGSTWEDDIENICANLDDDMCEWA